MNFTPTYETIFFFDSGKKKEVIILTKNKLIIKIYNSEKTFKTFKLDSNWLKINLIKLKNHTSKLQISSKNKSIIVGSFLRHQEKNDVIYSLEKALKKYNFNYRKENVSN